MRFVLANRLEGFKVALGAQLPANGQALESRAYKACGTYSGSISAGEEVTLQCADGATGLKLFIYLPRTDVLKICGIKAYRPGEGPEGPEGPQGPEGPGGNNNNNAGSHLQTVFMLSMIEEETGKNSNGMF